jgi:hypothetical protein
MRRSRGLGDVYKRQTFDFDIAGYNARFAIPPAPINPQRNFSIFESYPSILFMDKLCI